VSITIGKAPPEEKRRKGKEKGKTEVKRVKLKLKG
jgi:hypothetical protein